MTFLINLGTLCSQKKISLNSDGLPEGAKKLLELASAVPEKKDARTAQGRVSFLTHGGDESVDFFESSGDLPGFSGDAVIAVLRLLNGQAQYRRSDLGLIMQAVSVQALPIVSLICFWVGLILAFIGASQLQLFGAQIYVADLVGIAMVRLMAAIMTGIVMAGRTGGAFAAQLGTMQVNQEIAEGILQGVGKNWQSTAYH
ncbi:MAG: ABC transporter permease [Desulfobaccales bacterium]